MQYIFRAIIILSIMSVATIRLNAEFTRTPEHRNAILIFKRNHVAAASQQKQVLVRLTGILQAFLTYEKKVELLMELMS